MADAIDVLNFCEKAINDRISYNKNLANFFSNDAISVEEKRERFFELTENPLIKKNNLSSEKLIKIFKELSQNLSEYARDYEYAIKIINGEVYLNSNILPASKEKYLKIYELFNSSVIFPKTSLLLKDNRILLKLHYLYFYFYKKLKNEKYIREKKDEKGLKFNYLKEEESGYSEVPILENLASLKANY